MAERVIKNKFPGRRYENGIWKGPIVNSPPGHYKYGEVLLNSMKKNAKLIGQTLASTGIADTFGEMADRSIRCALWLRKQNIKPGDVIGICTPNHLNHLTPILASLFIGSIINPWWDNLEEELIRHFVELTNPKVIFVSEKNAKFIENVVGKAKIRNTKIIVFGNVSGLESFDDILKSQDIEEVEKFKCTTISSPDQPAIIFYTSGTTAKPKGVLHSYSALANNHAFIPNKLMRKNGMSLSSIAWISGTINPLKAIEFGSNIIVTSDISESDVFKLIEKYKVNWLCMGTGFANRMSKTPFINSHDFSTVRTVSVGGAIVRKKVKEFLDNIFPNAHVIQCYGCTELGSSITFAEEMHHGGTCGKVLENMEMKVVSEDGKKILGPNEEGEFYIRSPYMMLCYYKNSNATKESIDSENWFHSGDLGYYNEHGEFFIIDRIRELIKCRLNHAAPGPIEEIIHGHPCVNEVAVVAKPHIDDVEQAMAFVVKKPGANITEEEIINFVEKNMPERFHLNGGVKFLDELPSTVSGKIARRILRQIASRIAQEF